MNEILFDFSLQPISNRFLDAKTNVNSPLYPLKLEINLKSGLIRITEPFPINELKPHFKWLTCFEPEDHLDDLVQKLIKLPGINKSSVFAGYSFKDDSTLRRLETFGFIKNWRIDSVRDLKISDPLASIETYQCVLTLAKAREISAHRGTADVFIVRHVIEHAHDLTTFINAIKSMVSPGGYIVWELPDCEHALNIGDCTTLWEEHIFYFTGFTFKQLLVNSGFSIYHFESVYYPLENSLVAIVQQAPVFVKQLSLEVKQIDNEIARAKRFVQIMLCRKKEIRKKLLTLRKEKGEIAIFGAGHLSVAFISLMQVEDLISCVVDDNPNKIGMIMPIGQLPIVGSEALYSDKIKVCLLGLNPLNHEKLLTKHLRFVELGGIFASIFPGNELDLEPN